MVVRRRRLDQARRQGVGGWIGHSLAGNRQASCHGQRGAGHLEKRCHECPLISPKESYSLPPPCQLDIACLFLYRLRSFPKCCSRKPLSLGPYARPVAEIPRPARSGQYYRPDARWPDAGPGRVRRGRGAQGQDAHAADLALGAPLRCRRFRSDDRHRQGTACAVQGQVHPGAPGNRRAPDQPGRHAQISDPHGARHRGRNRLYSRCWPFRRPVRLVTGRLHAQLHLLPHWHTKAGAQSDRSRNRRPGPGSPR